jgi:hypothetical protein
VIDDPDLPDTVQRLRAQGWQVDYDRAAATVTILSADPATQTYGSTPSVGLTATVTAADGGHPAGRITFRSATTSLATVPLDADGTASYRLPADSPAGPLTVTAAFTPDDPEVAAASESDPVQVGVHMALSSTAADVTVVKLHGKQRALDLDITVRSGSDLPPDGSVSINLNGSKVATLPVTGGTKPTATVGARVPAEKGRATVVVTFLPAEPTNVQRSTELITVTV